LVALASSSSAAKAFDAPGVPSSARMEQKRLVVFYRLPQGVRDMRRKVPANHTKNGPVFYLHLEATPNSLRRRQNGHDTHLDQRRDLSMHQHVLFGFEWLQGSCGLSWKLCN